MVAKRNPTLCDHGHRRRLPQQVNSICSAANRYDLEDLDLSWITGIGLTPFGKHPGRSTLDLMSDAASSALLDAHLERGQIDGLLTGYSTTFPHLMLSTLFAEHFGIVPSYGHAIQLGGATGFAMAMAAVSSHNKVFMRTALPRFGLPAHGPDVVSIELRDSHAVGRPAAAIEPNSCRVLDEEVGKPIALDAEKLGPQVER